MRSLFSGGDQHSCAPEIRDQGTADDLQIDCTLADAGLTPTGQLRNNCINTGGTLPIITHLASPRTNRAPWTRSTRANDRRGICSRASSIQLCTPPFLMVSRYVSNLASPHLQFEYAVPVQAGWSAVAEQGRCTIARRPPNPELLTTQLNL